MDLNIFKIGVFIALILIYLVVRKLFKKFADFTENIGNSIKNEEELQKLKTKVIILEQKVNNRS